LGSTQRTLSQDASASRAHDIMPHCQMPSAHVLPGHPQPLPLALEGWASATPGLRAALCQREGTLKEQTLSWRGLERRTLAFEKVLDLVLATALVSSSLEVIEPKSHAS
jgi:hypothetical protein